VYWAQLCYYTRGPAATRSKTITDAILSIQWATSCGSRTLTHSRYVTCCLARRRRQDQRHYPQNDKDGFYFWADRPAITELKPPLHQRLLHRTSLDAAYLRAGSLWLLGELDKCTVAVTGRQIRHHSTSEDKVHGRSYCYG
jgi:hypothetical protein